VHCTRNSELERRQLPIGEGKKEERGRYPEEFLWAGPAGSL
jgi:hypothetical protein